MLERFARRDQNLITHKVNAGDFLRDGMLDLDAFVDFEEIKIAVVVHDEFDRAGVRVTRGLGDAHGGLADFVAQLAKFIFQQRRRRFFDELLVASLHGAITLAQVNDVAFVVAENLGFNVVRVLDEFFDIDAGIAESLFRLGARRVIAFDERNVIVRRAHAAPAATGDRLDHDRITNAFGDDEGIFFVLDDAFRTGRRGHAGLFGQSTAYCLVFQRAHGARTGPDEPDLDVHGICVHLRINRHRANVQLFAGADDADRDLPAVGDQNFFKHGLSESKQGSSGRVAAVLVRTNFEQRLAKFHRLAVFNQNLGDRAFDLGFDLVHHFHGFNDANHRVSVDFASNFNIVASFWRWSAVKSTNHRRLYVNLTRRQGQGSGGWRNRNRGQNRNWAGNRSLVILNGRRIAAQPPLQPDF